MVRARGNRDKYSLLVMPAAETVASQEHLFASSTPWGHRPHLDGLRAFAVYAVVLFHAGFGWAEGGFIGVDLFFLLSGYLVTNVLLSDLAGHGTLRLGRFYARRARRLIPAATVLIVSVAALSLLVLPSLNRSTIIGDAQAASLWYANWHFIWEAQDYFASEAGESPFLHFWSLAIEEQFYLVFPLVMLGLWRLRPRLSTLVGGVAVAFSLSLISQIVLAANDTNRAYFGTDARIYQILLGSLLAMAFWKWNVAGSASRRPAMQGVAEVVGWLSIGAFVVFSTNAIDLSVSARGFVAAALSLSIVCSLEVSGKSSVVQTLSARPLQYLGQISYGTYLWHWPLFVLAHSVLEVEPLAAVVISGVGGTAIAALSADLIEKPIRTTTRLEMRPLLVIGTGVAAAVVGGLIVAPTLLGLDSRPVITPALASVAVQGQVEEINVAVPDLDWEALSNDRAEVPPCEEADGSDCFVSQGSNGTILLIGDSHVRMLLPAIEAIAEERDMSVAIDWAGGCTWQDGLRVGEAPAFAGCNERRALTYSSRVDAIDPDFVLLAGRVRPVWDFYTNNEELADLGPVELFSTTTTETLEWLTARQPTLIVEPIPTMSNDPLSCLSAAQFEHECVVESIPDDLEDQITRRVAAEFGALTVDVDELSCPGQQQCQPFIDDIVVRRDRHHFTTSYARTLTPTIREAVDTLLGP